MGQIVGSAAKPKRCNLNKLSQLGTPAAGEHILVSSDNSMNAAGQGNFDRYIVGDGTTAATALELRYLDDSTHPYIVEEVNKAVAGIQPIEITGDVTNAPDEEDLTSENQGGTDVLKFKDKAYNSALYSGLGRIYLRKNLVTLEGVGKNVLTQAMVNTANTIYHIQYDYDLNGQTITLPAGCVLEFDGGSLKNGTITGNDTFIQGRTDLSAITLSGTFDNEFFDLYDAGCKPNDQNAASDNSTRMLALISSLENIKVPLVVPDGDWYYNTPLVLSGNFKLQCDGCLCYKSDANNVVNTALTIGNTTNSTGENHTIRVRQVSSYQFTSTIVDNVGLRLVNINSAEVTIAEATRFVYCIIIEANGAGCSYNTFNLGKFGWGNHYCGLKIHPIGDNGWVNENIFVGGSLHVEGLSIYKNNNVGLWVEGSTAHKANNNVFLKPCLEGSTLGVKFVNANLNCIYDMRNEAVTTLQQSTNSKTNFISTFQGTANFQAVVSDKITKFNIARQHVYSARTSYARTKIGSTWYASAVYLDVATYGTNTDVGQNIRLYGDIVYTGKIVDTSNVKCFSVGLKDAGRCVIRCYDANDNVISPSVISDVITANNIVFSVVGDGHTIVADGDKTYFDFEFTDDVKKAFIGCQASKSKYIEVYAYTQNKYGELGISTRLNVFDNIDTAEAVNVEVGDVLLDSNGVPTMWNGETWVDYFGNKGGLVRKGLTIQRPVLPASEFGFTYFDEDLGLNITGGKKSFLTNKNLAHRGAANNADKYIYAIPEIGNYFVKSANYSINVYRATTNDFSTAETIEVGTATKNSPLVFAIDSLETYPYILFANNYGSGTTVYFYLLDMSKWLEYDGAVAGVIRNGTTNQRPAVGDIYAGFQYFDTTLGKPIYYNGTSWVDGTGTAV